MPVYKIVTYMDLNITYTRYTCANSKFKIYQQQYQKDNACKCREKTMKSYYKNHEENKRKQRERYQKRKLLQQSYSHS